MTAPIAIFAYARPQHTARLIDSLLANPGWQNHPVTVYCDGAKKPEHAEAVAATRALIRQRLGGHAEIIESDVNRGLANSLIRGITEQTDRHGRVIVLEDDLVLSPAALTYFSRALEQYADDPQVMHIAGYFFPVRKPVPEMFFYRECSCWGWATWQRAWQQFRADAAALLAEIEADPARARAFDIDGSMAYVDMLRRQATGQLDSWAIRWYASVFLKGGLALHMRTPLVANEGFDGTGVHCGTSSIYAVKPGTTVPEAWPRDIAESPQAVRAMVDFRSRGLNGLPRVDRLKSAIKRRVLPFLPRPVVDRLVGWGVIAPVAGAREASAQAQVRAHLARQVQPVEGLIMLGTDYGTWPVLPRLLRGSVISAGAGEDISFDLLLTSHGAELVVVVDPTPRAITHFDAVCAALRQPRADATAPALAPYAKLNLSQVDVDRLTYDARALWDSDTELAFYPPKDPAHVSHSADNLQGTGDPLMVPATSIAGIVSSHGLTDLCLVKLDIEGAANRVISSMLADGLRPPMLAVEYDEILYPDPERMAWCRNCHDGLLAHGYRLVWFDGQSNTLYIRDAGLS